MGDLTGDDATVEGLDGEGQAEVCGAHAQIIGTGSAYLERAAQ